MAANWYFARHKQKLGPFTWNQLRQLAAFGLLQRSEHVLQEGTPKWRQAATVADLFPRQTTATQEYRLSVGGKPYGPYTADQIRLFLAAGRLPATTLAQGAGMAQWLPLAEIPEFAAYTPRSPESKAVLVVDRKERLSKEEAELHLAGKAGDPIARLLSQMLDLKRRFAHNTTLLHSLDQNIKHLLALREQRNPWGGGRD